MQRASSTQSSNSPWQDRPVDHGRITVTIVVTLCKAFPNNQPPSPLPSYCLSCSLLDSHRLHPRPRSNIPRHQPRHEERAQPKENQFLGSPGWSRVRTPEFVVVLPHSSLSSNFATVVVVRVRSSSFDRIVPSSWQYALFVVAAASARSRACVFDQVPRGGKVEFAELRAGHGSSSV